MSNYKHGSYGEFAASIGQTAALSSTIAVYIGTAPVNLIRGYASADIVNNPVLLKSMADVRAKIGYSSAWGDFTLCEAFSAHFAGADNIGPIVAINVLDPAVHKDEEDTSVQLTFTNGRATIDSNTIILDTLVLADKVEGTDYAVSYDFGKGKVIIDSIGETVISGTVTATFSNVDPDAVEVADIVGGININGEGSYYGIGCVSLVYQTLNVIPNLLGAPGWSDKKEVYDALVSASAKINGHWDALVVADIPVADVSGGAGTIKDAVTWKTTNGYTSERSKVCWPMVAVGGGTVYHLSTLTIWRMMTVDATHDGVPMETPSNKGIPAVKQYFGATSTNRGFDQQNGNELNAAGITTAVFFGGTWVLWGAHTAAYKCGAVADNRVIFDTSIRMIMHITNSFQRDWALTIDQPMTKALADTIKNREQEKLDALAGMGALIGTPEVRFDETANSTAALVEGDFVWDAEGTPTPPWKSGTLRMAYTTAGFNTYFGEEG